MQRLPPFEETIPLPLPLQTLRDNVCGDEWPTDMNLRERPPFREILRYPPHNLTEYRLNRIAEWSQPRYELDKRFVQLTLLLDKGEEPRDRTGNPAGSSRICGRC